MDGPGAADGARSELARRCSQRSHRTLEAHSDESTKLPPPDSIRYFRLWTTSGRGWDGVGGAGVRGPDRFRASYPGGQLSPRPPSRCPWRWKTVCPAPLPVLNTSR